ncbi:LOW QUALITY PROTEIN: rho GTPase-activating protein 29, partial [Thalassophryne amazonica]|uniref:LOW QUALITY PROTEIN: rho GTPase-activating protein 29 n=1 Tax=Thalassophryne amazonica TaxID=390379 RepID=UPI001470B7FE
FPEHQDCLHQAVHEHLGELLRVLKAIISKHQSLNSVDILSTAGTVIARVKGVNFKEVKEENKQRLFGEIYTAIDTLAFTFGNVVSDFLMGDVENGPVLGLSLTKRSRSSENLSVESGGSSHEKDCLPGPSPPVRAEEVDRTLQQQDGGVESVLFYAKAWSKYTKELLAWVEKRLGMDIECAKSYAKMAETAKTLASQQVIYAFREIYMSAFKNDIEYSQLVLQTAAVLQSNKFIQPLLARKNELGQIEKEMKEQWQREQKKMHEADSALRKARLLQAQRLEEYEKAKVCTSRLEEEQIVGTGGAAVAKQLEKRRRLEEEAFQKSEEAREYFNTCQVDVGVKKIDLAHTKSEIITQLREMVFQCDLTLKAVTVNWFQLQQAQVVSLPVNHQSLCENAKLYEPGQCYIDFVRRLPTDTRRPESLSFDSAIMQTQGMHFVQRSLSGSHSSMTFDFVGAEEVESPISANPAKIAERHSNNSTDIQALRIQTPFRPWVSGQGGGMCSDSESAGGSSESRSMDSPTASPGDFKRRLPRTPSTGTMSSADDLDEREPPSPFDNGLSEIVIETASSPGPFRNTQMSKASQTHKLRKLRAPSKCRECDGLVVFQGAECEECSLACHKKCLETLAIQCGHKKLQGRLHLFGIDFTQAARDSQDGIPFIIRKCTSEIENRALNMKGIYRVNGAKSRVEKLCQAFENGKDLVELSDLYPHDISNVLKLYLRQLPEPIILFRYYNDFIGLAKECQSIIAEELEAVRVGSTQATPAQLSVDLSRVLFKIKDLLRQLPPTHYKTLQFLMEHLHRVMEHSEENKMTASNLGIVFGPTLIKPRQTDAEVSLSSLVDYPYQALIVELLIRHYQMLFDTPLSHSGGMLPTEAAHPRHITYMTQQEKEQQLRRHSRSVGDIKEARQESSKVYKRPSSIIPVFHQLAEVQESTPSPEGSDFEPVDEVDSLTINGILSSSIPEVPKAGERGLSRSHHISVSKVQLRHTRNKFNSRPVSMPVERISNRDELDECNSQNNADHNDGKENICNQSIEEVDEDEKTTLVGSNYRSTFIDTQTLRRTWDKQYKHDVASRTAAIIASSPSENTTVDAKQVSISMSLSSTTCSFRTTGSTLSTVYPNKSYAVALQPSRMLINEEDPTKYGPVPTTFRAPRTLQPPPGTFYKPPSGRKAKMLQNCLPSHSTEEEEEEELGIKMEVSVDYPFQEDNETEDLAMSQSPSFEELVPNQAKPVYQRLRSKHLQEVEHREAHFV